MKFKVTMKDPDVLHEEMRRLSMVLADELAQSGLSAEEAESVAEMRTEKARDFAGVWMQYGEYLTVEFDTEAGTCTVVAP